MITTQRYHELKQKLAKFEAWRNGRTSYHQSEIPPHVPYVSNVERSQIEVYEFCKNPPQKYFCYVKREIVTPGVLGRSFTATTWTGQILGHGSLHKRFVCGKGLGISVRWTMHFKGINGHNYRGTYYQSAGDYCRVHRI